MNYIDNSIHRKTLEEKLQINKLRRFTSDLNITHKISKWKGLDV